MGLLTFGLAAFAADPAIGDLEKQVQELQRQVESLRAGTSDAARIAEIERQIQVLAAEIEKLKLGEAAPEPSEGRYGLGPSASKIYSAKKGVAFGGYGEVTYSNPSSTLQDGTPSGQTAQLDLLRGVFYFGAKFNDKIVFNSELEVEHATSGEGAEQRGEVALEFAYLDFLVNQPVNVRAGLLLVPMGFINERHEPPTYLGTRRPLVEEVIIPATWSEIGAGLFGDFGSKVTYRAYVTSGLTAAGGTSSGAEGFFAEGIRDGRAEGSHASAEKLALTGRIDGTPLAGLTLGASFFTGDAGQSVPFGAGHLEAWTTVADLHAEYRWRGLSARALYAHVSIDHAADVDAVQGLTGAESVGDSQYGWYGEVGYDVLTHVTAARQALIPYARYERLDTQDSVPSGFAADPANDVLLLTLGAMWKPIPNIALKLDWNQQKTAAQTGFDEVNLSLGFMF
jgi:hypothetical protein